MEDRKLNNPYVHPIQENTLTKYAGMTLRDYFAAKAMAEVPLSPSQRMVDDSDYDNWAKKCYKRADAMLKQREV